MTQNCWRKAAAVHTQNSAIHKLALGVSERSGCGFRASSPRRGWQATAARR